MIATTREIEGYHFIQRIFKNHAVCNIGTMPRLVQIETCFFWDNSLYPGT